MNLFDKMLAELRADDAPVLIYGTGIWAKKICRYLQRNEIIVSGFLLDRKYDQGDKTFLDLPVYQTEQYLPAHTMNLIVAFMNLSEERETELRKHQSIRHLYALDFFGRFAIDEDNLFSESLYAQYKGALMALRSVLMDEESKLQLDAYISQKRNGTYFKRFTANQQYYDEDVIAFQPNEVMVDCGAYDGDSVKAFLNCLHEPQNSDNRASAAKLYAFEPDPRNVQKLKNNLADIPNLCVVEKGVSDHSGVLCFSVGDIQASKVADSGIEIPVTTIDETVGDEQVTFIKMDIEGSELKALHGAEQTIRRCRPKLAVCVYHRPEDLVTIPQYILSLHPDYRLYFRNYRAEGVESVIYAI